MDLYKDGKGLYPHRSIPVESDERMMLCCSEVGWPPPCQQCNAEAEPTQQAQGLTSPQQLKNCATQRELLKTQYQCEARVPALTTTLPSAPVHPGQRKRSEPLRKFPHDARVQTPLSQQEVSAGPEGPLNGAWGQLVEESGSLERPLTLMSDDHFERHLPSEHPAALMRGPRPTQERRQSAQCPPARLEQHNINYYHPRQNSPAGSPRDRPFPQPGLIHEVSVHSSLPVDHGANMRGVRIKTISLPEECRNIFITYSVDTASDMFPFTKFLTDQGFRPAIDIFDNPIRRLDVTKWMDSFLKDKSVLIIMAISPRYKEDVEGVGDEEHGLHTKYIHNQLQNEFIQQGCLNFRLVPVLFQNATKKHVPHWLHSTRIYRWPWDIQDLLLRLLREERYILPQQDTDLTITVRPL